MANVCETKITVIGLKDAPETFVKALSRAMFGIDWDSMNPKRWGEDESIDGKTWYATLVAEFRQQRHAQYCVLYPYKPYEKLGVTAPRFYIESKWSPPVKEIREASKSFPELTFHLDWWIEQDGPSGELVIAKGEEIDEMFRPASWYLVPPEKDMGPIYCVAEENPSAAFALPCCCWSCVCLPRDIESRPDET